MNQCKECGGNLKVLGIGYFGDTVEVECEKCHEYYEVEPDGLGRGGEEFVEAQMLSFYEDD